MRLPSKTLLAFTTLCATGLAAAEPLSSSAGDISLRMSGFSNGYAAVDTSLNNGYIAAGRLHGMWTQNGTSSSFLTYCTDIYQSFSWNTDYLYTLVGKDTPNGLSSRQEDLMGKLFTLAGAAVNSTDTSAAFQLATWEIVNEVGTALDVGSGVFRLEQGGSTAQRQLANGWLSAVLDAGAQKSFDATRLYSSVAQDFVVFTATTRPNGIVTRTVPEPGNLALALLALTCVLATHRRARQRLLP